MNETTIDSLHTTATTAYATGLVQTIIDMVVKQVVDRVTPQLSAIVKHEVAHAQLQNPAESQFKQFRREDIEGIVEDKLDNLRGFTMDQESEIETIVERLTTDLTDGQKSDVSELLRMEKEDNIARAIREDDRVQSALRQFILDTVSVTLRCD